jgi:flagellar basal-body rod protein FlgB
MMNELDAAPVRALSLALDAASLRHRVIAHNIANANTPGFAPLRVSFEQSFAAALQPVVARDASARVELDVEVTLLAQNALHYQTALRGLSKYFAILSSAISEGKR